MKNIKLLFAFCLFTGIAQARIIRVNNGGVACLNSTDCYTGIAAAQTAANAGDTIHIEPSGTSYGNITFTKRLVVLGNGFFLGNAAANGNDGLQADPAISSFGNITIGSDADGLVLKGLQINILNLLGSNAANTLDQVVIMRNRMVNGVSAAWTKNLFFTGNVVGSTLNTGMASNGNNVNFYVANNVLWNMEYDASDNGRFEHNIITGGSQPNAVLLYNSIVQNNISTTGTAHTFSNCTVRNNLARSATAANSYGTLNGNQNNIDMATVFADFANNSTAYSADSRWTLAASSPATGAGFEGVDCGIFGGSANPYKLSGIPDIPAIYQLSIPASAAGSTINITISTRANN